MSTSAQTPAFPQPAFWSVIVPLKQTTRGKSRLTRLDADRRRELALAFALDTVTAALAATAVGRLVVVTNDTGADRFAALGAEVLPDSPDAGLNPAIVHAAQVMTASDPTSGLVALTGDLPALASETLDLALSSTPAGRWFVSDSIGTGTTLLAATGERLAPRFGPHSRAAHRAGGAVELDVPGLARLRRDVDTEVDLWDAIRLGVGAHTEAALAGLPVDRALT